MAARPGLRLWEPGSGVLFPARGSPWLWALVPIHSSGLLRRCVARAANDRSNQAQDSLAFYAPCFQSLPGRECVPRRSQSFHPESFRRFRFSSFRFRFSPVCSLPLGTGAAVPLRSHPQGAKITGLLASGTFDRSVVSNYQSGPRLERSFRKGAQPDIASRLPGEPEVVIRRRGRKADRVRLGQCPLLG